MSFDLTGTTALVTGASRDPGRHLAIALARAGAKVALAARRVERLQALEREIVAFDGRAIAIRLDTDDPDSVRHAVEVAETELGALGVLVNAAGPATPAAAPELGAEAWDAALRTRLRGAWLMAQETARHMERLGHGGSIVNLIPAAGAPGAFGAPADAATRAGLVGLTRQLALDWADRGIRVNALAAGPLEPDPARDGAEDTAEAARRRQIPQGRCARPGDLEGPLLLLASPQSAHMTGSVVTVDGGLSARS